MINKFKIFCIYFFKNAIIIITFIKYTFTNILENKVPIQIPFVLQYFKMDPENYDDYGGVQHAEYCFQVKLSKSQFSSFLV